MFSELVLAEAESTFQAPPNLPLTGFWNHLLRKQTVYLPHRAPDYHA